MIAALFVMKNGCYFGLSEVDPWDESRDAKKYTGPYPVIAHPPCQRWGKFWAGQPLWIAKTGQRKKKGDDDGCFKSALASVRKFGGVLEHPLDSHAWEHFGLVKPPRLGGWVKADNLGGFTCCVEQGKYGHYARKPTWLYAVGIELRELEWGKSLPVYPQWAIEKYGIEKCKKAGELAFKGGGTDNKYRISTPELFRDLLIDMVKTVNIVHGLIK